MTATAVALRERPILFSGPMVRALLSGQKTQTRRVVLPLPPRETVDFAQIDGPDWTCIGNNGPNRRCPFGAIGDRLWVRETWNIGRPALTSGPSAGAGFVPKLHFKNAPMSIEQYRDAHPDFKLAYAATWDGVDVPPMRPSIHMPRWASRLALELTDVRVERLQEITNDDAVAEGIELWGSGPLAVQPETRALCQSPRAAFGRLWDSLNAKRGYGWDVNPWVWVLAFRRVA